MVLIRRLVLNVNLGIIMKDVLYVLMLFFLLWIRKCFLEVILNGEFYMVMLLGVMFFGVIILWRVVGLNSFCFFGWVNIIFNLVRLIMVEYIWLVGVI